MPWNFSTYKLDEYHSFVNIFTWYLLYYLLHCDCDCESEFSNLQLDPRSHESWSKSLVLDLKL